MALGKIVPLTTMATSVEKKLSFHVTRDIYAPVEIAIESLVLDIHGSDWGGHDDLYELICLHTLGKEKTGVCVFASVGLRDDHGTLGVPLETSRVNTFCDVSGSNPTIWCVWDEMVTFPVKVRDLDVSTCLCVTVWCSYGSTFRVLGGSIMPMFNKYGRLITVGECLALSLETSSDDMDMSKETWMKGNVKFQLLDDRARLQWLEIRQSQFLRGDLEGVPWLDRVSSEVLKDRILTLKSEQGLRRGLELHIRLPKFPHEVFFSDSDIIPQSNAQVGTKPGQRMTRDTQVSSLHAFMASEDEPPAPSDHLITFQDPEINKEPPVESMELKLARSMARKKENPHLRPNTQEKSELDRIIKYPPSKGLTRDERDIIWRFRYSITTDKKAITKFLKSVDWADAEEAAQAEKLMETWARIDVGDALEMLSPVFQNPVVRSFAVSFFTTVDDDVLDAFLLQLVQALRYQDQDQSELSAFLVNRACQNRLIASSLFWYLCAEIEDDSFGTRAQVLQKSLLVEMDAADFDASLPTQLSLLARLRHLFESAKSCRSADAKTDKIRSLLESGGSCEDLSHFTCPNPLDPSVTLSGIIPELCLVFRSKVNPIKFSWNLVEGKSPTSITSFIYKKGDDLRQDQLVLQIFTIMDSLLKKEHLDLQITRYRVLPTAVDDGLIQFVPHASPLSYILRNYGTILQYLDAHVDTSGTDMKSKVRNNYIRSCAGYTVFTHILGIGDRHNDNIMVTTEGRLFHIDFGYFLGRDPKFSVAPLFLSRTLVDAMGGPDSDGYHHFVQLACEAFNILRKSAGLLLSVIHVMANSSIPDIRSDPETAMLKVQDKLWLNMSDEDAAHAFESTLIAAQNAVLPRIAEVQHRVMNAMGQKHPKYSVIIPALNEQDRISNAVRSAAKGRSTEVIVVDGGSDDDTIRMARAAGASKIYTSGTAGRSIQMNLGAKKSTGDILLFLHADCTLPSGYDDMIDVQMNPNSAWGCFRSIDIASHDINPVFAFFMKQTVGLRTGVFRKPYGDQAIFVRKTTFHDIGGYRSDWKLLEDVELVEKLNNQCGSPAIVPHALKTSGRRWNRLGALRTTMLNQYILFRYAIGDSVNELEKIYRKKR